jgi:hypothetical protein
MCCIRQFFFLQTYDKKGNPVYGYGLKNTGEGVRRRRSACEYMKRKAYICTSFNPTDTFLAAMMREERFKS